jgi:hypothetical protein
LLEQQPVSKFTARGLRHLHWWAIVVVAVGATASCSLLTSFDGFGGASALDGAVGDTRTDTQDEGSDSSSQPESSVPETGMPDQTNEIPDGGADIDARAVDGALDTGATPEAQSPQDATDALSDGDAGATDALSDGDAGPYQYADAPNGAICGVASLCDAMAISKVVSDGACVDNAPNWKNDVPSCGEINNVCNLNAVCGNLGTICHSSYDCVSCCQ